VIGVLTPDLKFVSCILVRTKQIFNEMMMFCTSLVNVYSDRSLEQQFTSRHSNALFLSTSSRHPVELPLDLLIVNPRGAAATNTILLVFGLTLTITERAIHPCQDEYDRGEPAMKEMLRNNKIT
jgi:hypothetical protein